MIWLAGRAVPIALRAVLQRRLCTAPFKALERGTYDELLPASLRAELPSPQLVVFMDQVKHNLAAMLAHCGGDTARWRPHLKTTKMAPVYDACVALGVRHFKCATVREARLMCSVMRERGVRDGDVLLAYPLIGPSLKQLADLAAEYSEVRLGVLCEDSAAAPGLPASLGVFIDINPGYDRTGVPFEATDDIAAIAKAAGARFRGLHYYDGHISHVSAERRRAEADTIYGALDALVATLGHRGIAVEEVITSGTPTCLEALRYYGERAGEVPTHRISPGTVVFHDCMSEEREGGEALGLVPAALVLSRVISHPRPWSAPGEPCVITLDAGSKALACEAGSPVARVLEVPQLRALSPSEEHLPMASREPPPPRGTPLLLIPRHVCPTVNLAEHALVVERGEEPKWVEVAARAH